MDIRRIILYVIVALLGASLVSAWIKDHPRKVASSAVEKLTSQSQKEKTRKDDASYTPTTFDPGAPKSLPHDQKMDSTTKTTKVPTGRQIQVKTDVLEVTIDRKGGNIVNAKLVKYPLSLQEKNVPVTILSDNPTELYIAQSGITNTGKKGQSIPVQYTAAKKKYILKDGQNQLIVELKGKTANGLAVTKKYTFEREHYAVKLSYQIVNRSSKTWSGSLFAQITRRKPTSTGSRFYDRSYNGAAISSPQTPYEKLPYKDMDKQNISRNTKGGWVAMQQHYFLTAWIPASQDQTYHQYTHTITPPGDSHNIYVIGFVSPHMTIKPGAEKFNGATLYVGPEIAKRLHLLAPGLDHTVDYGWLWWISIIIFWILSKVHSFVGNWGWSIVITTIIIKIVFYWFTAKSFRSMAKMRELQPRLQALKERYGDDRQAMSKATMEFYKKEKVNPLGGCLPMLIQVPVFIALYYVLIESVQLRLAPFLWIPNLAAKDPYYILPLLMGASMFVQQWLTPTSFDPTQQKMMWILPVIFTVFFLNFPAGLVLYWFVNNVVQVLQQWYVTKTYEKHMAKKKARKNRKKK